jgi:transposase
MGAALAIRTDLAGPAELRRLARREGSPRTATRMMAIANALEGMARAEAARLAGMERQALRDAVVRYNAEGLAGLRDRPKPGRPPALTEPEQALLLNAVFRGPDRARDGCVEWTLPALCRWIDDRFGKRLHPASLSRIVRRLDLSRQKTRSQHPRADERAQAAFAKGGSRGPSRPSPRRIPASASSCGSRTRPASG